MPSVLITAMSGSRDAVVESHIRPKPTILAQFRQSAANFQQRKTCVRLTPQKWGLPALKLVLMCGRHFIRIRKKIT